MRPSALTLALLALVAACGHGSGAPKVLPAAPEPAHAPPASSTPTGTILTLGGGRPEGLVADPVSGLVVVALRGPDRLALVDPATGRVVKQVPVAGSARHLELVPLGGGVIVPGEDTDLITTVALPAGLPGSPVPVRRQPHDVAVTADGTQYVADEFGGAVSMIRDGRVARTFEGLIQPGGAAGTGDTGAVVDVRARLLHLYRDGREVGRLPAGAGPTHALALEPGTILVTDTSGGALLLYDVAGTPRLRATIPLAGRPYGTAYDPVRKLVYITATARNLLVQYRLHGNRLEQLATFPTVQNAYSVAVVPSTGRVAVAGESGSVLQLLDP